jgi:hypothetical protein
MPPKKKSPPPHVSLYRIEEERRNVLRRTQTRIASLQEITHRHLQAEPERDATSSPTITLTSPSNVPVVFAFCVGILLMYSGLSFAYLNNCVCTCTPK